MKTRMMRKIALLVTGSALAVSFPVAGAIAESGGVPHSGSQGKGKQQKQNGHDCPTWSNGKGTTKPVSSLPNDQARTNGKKCGFEFGLTPR
jgi:hypothetical protein